ncbi:MAG: hypothetical protein KDK90_17630 [Leptospiraceae bacterium]|nr:hypothetical protein [Leptospiraceae bacterium]
MKTYQIELLEPKAKKLLDELANLKLIKIQEKQKPTQEFRSLLTKIREKKNKKLTLEEITKEVELVRRKRYAQKKKKSDNS